MIALTAFAITTSGSSVARAEPSADLNKKIDAASEQLEDVTESYNKMRLDLKKTADDAARLAASLKPAQDALVVAKAKVQTIATTSYMQGRVGSVSVIVGGRKDLMQRLAILEQIADSNQQDITTYTETTQTFAERQAALKITEAKQAAQLKELEKRKKTIEADLKKLYAMRTAAYGKATETGSSYTGKIPSIPCSACKTVTFVYNAIGMSFGYGDDGPCS